MSINSNSAFHLIECPRDAMQGWKRFIPTEKKVEYINTLLQVGFDTLDFGSFVSPQAIPQMADTKDVIKQLKITDTKLLAIVANVRGAKDAVQYDAITYLGFPFSISETFQQRNTKSSMQTSLLRVIEIQNLCIKHGKQLVVYISMGFGNPYGDIYSHEIVLKWVNEMVKIGVKIVSIADTVGIAKPQRIQDILKAVIPQFKDTEIGVHLHSTTVNWRQKCDAALQAGCRRFDGALKGFGGCPMAKDELVGNMDTELMIPYFEKLNLLSGLNKDALAKASQLATEIFI